MPKLYEAIGEINDDYILNAETANSEDFIFVGNLLLQLFLALHSGITSKCRISEWLRK